MMLINQLKIGPKMEIIVIGALVGMVAISAFQLVELRNHLFQDRQLKTEHVVDVVIGLLDHYHKREVAGEINKAEVQQAALAAIKDLRYGNNDYFWIQTVDGTMIMHPIMPEMDGQELRTFKDPNGKYLFNHMQNLVKTQGSGFVDYLWPKPGHEKPQPKISYVAGFEPWGWIVGSGVYVDDVNAAFFDAAIVVVFMTVVIAMVIGGGAWLIGRDITKPIAEIASEMLRLANGDTLVKVKNTDLPNEVGDLSRAMKSFLEKTVEMEQMRIKVAEQTVRDRLAEEMQTRERLEALGTLAGGVAHEINSPLQYVTDNLRFIHSGFEDVLGLLDEVRKDGEQRGDTKGLSSLDAASERADLDFLRDEMPATFKQTQEGLDQINRIVQAIKEFSHPGGSEKVAVDLNALVETALTVSRNQWKYAATVETDLDPALPAVPCFADGMRQALLNLIINAAHAIADKVGPRGEKGQGKISIRTRFENDNAVIEVADTGMGIPAAIADKVFDLFFTTKAPGKGTGQGLALCHSVVVQQHAGHLTFTSEEGEGTRFHIELPLSSA